MTLRYDQTASDCAATQILARLAHGRLWHDGYEWHSLNHADRWISGRSTNHVFTLLHCARALPNHPYWYRLRQRCGFKSTGYQVLGLMRDAAFHGILLKPDSLDKPYLFERRVQDCLCYGSTCQYPPIPEDAY